MQGPEQIAWLTRLETDHDNLRAALRWSLDRDDTELALRFGGALALFWDAHGSVREGREWLDELLAPWARGRRPLLTPVSRRAFAKVLDGAAYTRARWSEFATAVDLQTQGLAIWRELDDKRGIAEALNRLGETTRDLGDRARGKGLIAESLVLFRELSDKRGIAHALSNLAK